MSVLASYRQRYPEECAETMNNFETAKVQNGE
jgi:hypothetical protein